MFSSSENAKIDTFLLFFTNLLIYTSCFAATRSTGSGRIGDQTIIFGIKILILTTFFYSKCIFRAANQLFLNFGITIFILTKFFPSKCTYSKSIIFGTKMFILGSNLANFWSFLAPILSYFCEKRRNNIKNIEERKRKQFEKARRRKLKDGKITRADQVLLPSKIAHRKHHFVNLI